MTDHLPECKWGAGYFKRIAEHLFGPDYPCPQCDALRRCERRVRFAVAQEGAMESGWKAGLNALRDRIMRLPYEIDGEILIDRDEVIKWIDELRGEK